MKTKATSEDRIKIFNDTLDWIDSDAELAQSVINAKKTTEVYFEDDYPAFNKDRTVETKIEVSGYRSFEAACRLSERYPDKKIAVLNFANAFQAGGGVAMGAGAQEECLCRTSTLYPLLYRRTLRDTFYKHHKDMNTPKASDSLIYTEGVIICKSDDDYPERLPRDKWKKVDVITMAAPDLRKKSNIYVEKVGNCSNINDAELFGYHVKRAIHLLTVAASKGAKVLVLGAFGCGAFENDPAIVAQAYKTALSVFPKVFEHIEFAVYCPSDNTVNYEQFAKALNCE